MTDLERFELALRSIEVNDTWTPTELLNAIINEVTKRNIEATIYPSSAHASELEWRRD